MRSHWRTVCLGGRGIGASSDSTAAVQTAVHSGTHSTKRGRILFTACLQRRCRARVQGASWHLRPHIKIRGALRGLVRHSRHHCAATTETPNSETCGFRSADPWLLPVLGFESLASARSFELRLAPSVECHPGLEQRSRTRKPWLKLALARRWNLESSTNSPP